MYYVRYERARQPAIALALFVAGTLYPERYLPASVDWTYFAKTAGILCLARY
jgi:hypothetical protein